MTGLLFENWPTEEDKICNKCCRSLPRAKFCTASGGTYLRSECRDCEKAANRIRTHLKKSVIPPSADYTCPICKKNEEQLQGTGGKKSGTWCCDHNHENGMFRGWLCHNCNRAIGTMNDDIERLLAAVEYLKRNK
jgi:hypothetical protein